MTERRETGPKKGGKPRRAKPRRTSKRKDASRPADWSEGERIAKYLARCGVASRRDCEALIEAGKVFVNDERLISPAFKVTGRETIRVGRKVIRPPEPARLWRYHKPAGLITTTKDPDGRSTIFDELPKSLPRTVTIGRLDLTTEGLLLLTNDGELARALELPANAFTRRYRARAHGRITQEALDTLANGLTVDGVDYKSIKAVLERTTGTNNWITVDLVEGKNREVRKALEAVGLQVNRLIRIEYGPFSLGELKPGAVEEIHPDIVMDHFREMIATDRQPGSKKPRRRTPSSQSGKIAATSRLGSRRSPANVSGKAKRQR